MMLLLGCVVMCEGKGPLIEKMKGMELLQQQALVAHIQQVQIIVIIKPPLCILGWAMEWCLCVCWWLFVWSSYFPM